MIVRNRNLGRLVVGQFISAIGDQFYLIGMPWLALQITGSAFVAGTVLAVASAPRAVFLLVGGAITDRYSAKRLLIVSNGIQGVLMGVLGFATVISFTPLWFLYGLAFLTGFVDAFGLPAFNTVLPQIVNEDELETGNIYLQGANMASGVIGPALAGLSIWMAASGTGAQSEMAGLWAAFLIDSVTYFIGISFFGAITVPSLEKSEDHSEDSLVSSMKDLAAFIKSDPQLRNLFGLMMVFGLFLTGTIRLGFPMLADALPAGGVRYFGYMSSAFGAGMLAGMVSVKLLPQPPQAVSGVIALLLFAFLPAGLILLGMLSSFGVMIAIIIVMGSTFGYVNIFLLSWLQRRTPGYLLGRMMAVVLFSAIGLSPVSQAGMGYLLDQNVQATLIGVGGVVLLLLAITGANREMWSLKSGASDNTLSPEA